jgi:hypothetical protein
MHQQKQWPTEATGSLSKIVSFAIYIWQLDILVVLGFPASSEFSTWGSASEELVHDPPTPASRLSLPGSLHSHVISLLSRESLVHRFVDFCGGNTPSLQATTSGHRRWSWEGGGLQVLSGAQGARLNDPMTHRIHSDFAPLTEL